MTNECGFSVVFVINTANWNSTCIWSAIVGLVHEVFELLCLSKSALLSYHKTSLNLHVVQTNPQKTQNVFPSAAVMQILEDGHQLIHRRRSRRRSPSSSTSSLKSGSQTSNKWKQCGKYKRNMAFVSCANLRNITVSLSPHTADSLQFNWMPALLLEISRGHGEQMWWGAGARSCETVGSSWTFKVSSSLSTSNFNTSGF